MMPSPEGFIFGCTTDTENECRRKRLFGLPPFHKDAVLAIRPGTTLFLYNHDRRVLYGVFWAASRGNWGWDADAWGGRCPAQVRVRGINVRPRHGEGLPREAMQAAVGENYFNVTPMGMALNRTQVARLVEGFRSRGWRPDAPAVTQAFEAKGFPKPPVRQRQLLPGRGIRKSSEMERRQGNRKPMLRLTPGMPPPPRRGNRRHHFSRLRGYRVVVDERHPIEFYRPPERPGHRPADRPTQTQGQSLEDWMEIEMEESMHPDPQSEAETRFVGRGSSSWKQPSEATGGFVAPGQDAPVAITQPSPVIAEQKWSLGEVTWRDPQEFRTFLCGRGELPYAEEAVGAVQSAPTAALPSSARSSMTVVENSSPTGNPPVVNVMNNQGQTRTDTGTARNSGIVRSSDLALLNIQNESHSSAPHGTELSSLTNNLSSLFESIGYRVTTVNVPLERQIPGSMQQHLGIALLSQANANFY